MRNLFPKKIALLFKYLFNIFSVILLFTLNSQTFAQATFTSGSTATALATEITGPGVTITSPVITNGTSTQVGIFSNGITGASLQIDTGIILTTGDVTESFTTNNNADTSDNPDGGNTYFDANLTSLTPDAINDVVVFEFDATLDPTATVLTIDYQFMSEEYTEYVGSEYNDTFAYFVSGPGLTGTQNIALVPGTSEIVSINTINNTSHSEQYLNNSTGTITMEYDGITKKLRATATGLTPGETYHVKFAIGDTSDYSYDSAILINLITGYSDTDDDGVSDDADLDDDNDGILDTVEDANLDNDNNPQTNPTDTDGDGVPNYLDLDSDGDGIPDNVEAQTTSGYIAPTSTFSSSGIDTAYGTGLTAINTDGTSDGADYLDIDSDNDGINDTAEAGIVLSGNLGNNGLDNGLQFIDSYDDVNGDLNAPTTLPDGDNDLASGGDVDYRDSTPSGDNDGDGILDIDDLDDDNDGITDAQELCNSNFIITTNSVIRVYIDLGAYENENGWQLTRPDGTVIQSVAQGTYNDNDDIIDLSFTVTTQGNYTFTITDSASDGLDTNNSGGTGGYSNENSQALYRIYLDGVIIQEKLNNPSFYSESTTITVNGTGSFPCFPTDINADDDTDNIPNYADSDYNTGIPGDTINANGIWTSLDFDGDGKPNHMDLDSDGDGIPDNIEAQPTNSYTTPNSTFSSNGIDTAYGAGLTSLVNTDANGLPDYKDVDSDNDGINDSVEFGFTLNGVIGANGLDSAIYTTSNFNDVNGIINNPNTLPDSDSDLTTGGDVDYRDDTIDVSAGIGNILWLRADKDATTTLWQDQSGNGKNAIGTASNPTITTNGLNFNPVFNFNNNKLEIENGLFSSSSSNVWTYSVIKANTLKESFVLVENGDGGKSYHSKIPSVSTEYELRLGNNTDGIITASVDNITSKFEIYTMGTSLTTSTPFGTRQAISKNGNRIITSNNSDSMNGNVTENMFIGNNNDDTAGFEGDIAEILVFDQIPTVTAQQKVESYLALKYGITLETTDNIASIIEGDYILSNEVTKVWDYTANATYHNNVAGIGRDDTFNFNQKQSKSINTDAIVTIGLGNISSANVTNVNSFTSDKDYLVWGNDAVAMGATSTNGVLCATDLQLDRKWKIVETGNVSTTQIALTKSVIDTYLTNSSYSKVIKIADDEALTTNVEFISLSEATVNGVLSYVGNYDFNGTKFFTVTEVNAITWNGSTNSWSGGSGIGGAPNTTDTGRLVTIDAEGTTNHAVLTTSASVGCVWIKGNSKLTVNTDNFLQISDDLKLSGELRMVGSAQLLQTHTGNSKVSGNGKLFIDQQGTVTTTYRYNYWTSPVTSIGSNSFTVADVMKDGTTPTSETSTPLDINFIDYTDYNSLNGNHTTSPITLANYWIYSFVNGLTSTAWIQQKQTGTFEQAEAYILKGPGAVQNYTFVGTPNDGDITTPLNGGFSSLIGNPYPSALNASQFLTDNISVIKTLYFWEHKGDAGNHSLAGYVGGYGIMNSSMATAAVTPVAGTAGLGGETYTVPGDYIPVGQGFFAEGTITGGTITFKNSQRVYQKENEDGGSSSIFFKSNKKPLPILKIGVDYTNVDGIELHRQLGVSFKKGNSFKEENGFDSEAYSLGETDAYLKFEGNRKKFIIAGIQEISNELEFPITLRLANENKITLMIDEKKHINEDIILTDKVTGNVYNLKEPITFELNSGIYSDRFYISFKRNALNINDDTANQMSFFYNDKNKIIQLNKKNNLEIKKVDLYDILGKKVNSWLNIKNNSLKLPNYKTGIYIIKIHTDKGNLSKKILYTNK